MGCPVTCAGSRHSVSLYVKSGGEGTKRTRATNQGWEPPLTVYPRGQGDIPQHLWDWPNRGTGAWLLLSGKEETMKKCVTRDEVCKRDTGREIRFWGQIMSTYRESFWGLKQNISPHLRLLKYKNLTSSSTGGFLWCVQFISTFPFQFIVFFSSLSVSSRVFV